MSAAAGTTSRSGLERPGESATSAISADYCASLLRDLGRNVQRAQGQKPAPSPVAEWAASGAMALTGRADGPPVARPAHVASCMRGALDALRAMAGNSGLGHLDGAALLGERAATAGLRRSGTISAGGSCRLLPTLDGHVAVNLPRADDLRSLPAWLGEGDTADPWRFVADALLQHSTAAAVGRARLLGLAVAEVSDAAPTDVPWYRVAAEGPARSERDARAPLVLDLSSLWAGPLCTHLLGLVGARVIKIESSGRPDGARGGPPAFFDLMNAGKQSVEIDPTTAAGADILKRLVARADIVVESARPRALEQLGIDAASIVHDVPGITWVSITGYGRSGDAAQWIAFGDDAAAAAGLAGAAGESSDVPLFCADAVADPLTGVHAAAAALAARRSGGGRLLDISLRDVSAHVLGFAPIDDSPRVHATDDGWQVVHDDICRPVAAPRARPAAARARPLGTDTAAVLDELLGRCS